MEKRTSFATRVVAALSLVLAGLVIVVLVASAMNDSDSKGQHHHKHQAQKENKPHRTKADTYTVQTGDTLTAIAHKTGVPVAEILALNPEVDPQILIAGQTLKLK